MKRLKKIELATYDVEEMNRQEMMNAEGGSVWSRIKGAAHDVGEWVKNAAEDVEEWCKDACDYVKENAGFDEKTGYLKV